MINASPSLEAAAHARWARAEKPQETIRVASRACSLGVFLVAASERGVCALSLGDDEDLLMQMLHRDFSGARAIDGDRGFEPVVDAAARLIEAPQQGFNFTLDIRGTAFQRRVWAALREIPAGSTASYRDVACRVGAPLAARAVANACGANKIAVAIPCHRVVQSDGALGGFSCGVERKRSLLQREWEFIARGSL